VYDAGGPNGAARWRIGLANGQKRKRLDDFNAGLDEDAMVVHISLIGEVRK
jgi:hypothetical protein